MWARYAKEQDVKIVEDGIRVRVKEICTGEVFRYDNEYYVLTKWAFGSTVADVFNLTQNKSQTIVQDAMVERIEAEIHVRRK